jgi:hypothetical protein
MTDSKIASTRQLLATGIPPRDVAKTLVSPSQPSTDGSPPGPGNSPPVRIAQDRRNRVHQHRGADECDLRVGPQPYRALYSVFEVTRIDQANGGRYHLETDPFWGCTMLRSRLFRSIGLLISPMLVLPFPTTSSANERGASRYLLSESCERIKNDRQVLTEDDDPELRARGEKLTSAIASVRGVRGLLLLTDSTFRLIVGPDFVPPTDGWAKDLGIEVVTSCIPDQFIDLARSEISKLALANNPKGYTSVGYSPVSDSVEAFSTALSDSEMDRAVSSAFKGDSADWWLSLYTGVDGGPAFRSADVANHFGGSKIVILKNFPGGNKICSSGFYVTSPYGPFMLTAKHCSLDQNGVPKIGYPVANGVPSNTGSSSFGSIAAVAGSGLDFALINGSTYAGRTYSFTDDTSSRPVFGTVGYNLIDSFCNYGHVTRRRCAGVWILSALITYDGEQHDLTVSQDQCAPTGSPLADFGDSGGPIVREVTLGKVNAAGMMVTKGSYSIPGGLMCTRGDERWSTMAATFGLSIVNG